MVPIRTRFSRSGLALGLGITGACLGVSGWVLSTYLISYKRTNFASFISDGFPAQLEWVNAVIPWLMLSGAGLIVGAVLVYVSGLIVRRRLLRQRAT